MLKNYCSTILWVAHIDQGISLHLPSCCPRFESQAHHLRFCQFTFELCHVEKTKINKKEAGIDQFLLIFRC